MSIDWVTFIQIAGEGESALYNMYIDGKRVGEALTFEELQEKLCEVEEEKECTT